LRENVLSIRLGKGTQSDGVVYKEGDGAYTFGGVEEEYIVGGRSGLQWAPVTSANYWYVRPIYTSLSRCRGLSIDDIGVGSTSALVNDEITPKRAIIDTGVSRLSSPLADPRRRH
jgi:hypothetical protein